MDDVQDDPDREDRPCRRMPDDWQPRRRNYDDSRDDYDENYGYVDAREKVLAPGLALLILGWVGAFFSVLAMGGAIAFAILVAAPEAERITLGIIGFVVGLLMLAGSIFFVLAGNRMRQCRNWGLCLAGAIVAMASIILLGLLSVLIMPFGIWALVVLLDAGVKREFERVAGTDRPRRTSSDDWD